MAVMLNGASDLLDQSQYWALYIKNNAATKGVDYSVLESGDCVVFVNEPYSEEKHSKNVIGQRHRIHHAS